MGKALGADANTAQQQGAQGNAGTHHVAKGIGLGTAFGADPSGHSTDPRKSALRRVINPWR